ncbi:MAG TPA: YncE family protein [Gammaproteobacteria bacterium]|nr:YncE family protein [Gammaproteobacteria bacterium]
MLLIVTLSLGLALALPAGATSSAAMFPEPMYVTLQGSDRVESLPKGITWSGLKNAHYVDASPDGKLLLVSSQGSAVYVVDTATGETRATFQIGAVPQGVQIGPNGHWGLAVSAGTDSVAAIDLQALKLVKTIKVGKTPHNIRFSADGERAYVTLQGETGVAVLDMSTLTRIGEIPVPGIVGPHNLDISADGTVLWVRDLVGNVAAVNINTQKELAVIKVGAGHAGIDVIPGGRYVFTGAIADDVVDVIDPKTFKVVKRIEVGDGPHGVRASADGRWVYVAVTGTDKVAVIDAHSLEVVRQIPVKGKLPFWIAVPGND